MLFSQMSRRQCVTCHASSLVMKETHLERFGNRNSFIYIYNKFVYYAGEEVILVPHDGVEVARLGVIEEKEVGVVHSLLYQNHVVQV